MATDGADRNAGTRRFDVVVRGYDRRQVDEHLSRLQRTIVRLRNELDMARALQTPPPVAQAVGGRRGGTGDTGYPAGQSPRVEDPDGRPRPSPRPRPQPAAESSDVVSMFNGRMKSILQAAEEEAAEIRHRAEVAAQVEHEKARRRNADVTRQHDAVVAELARLRGQLDALLAAPTVQLPSVRPTPSEAPARSGPAQFQAPDLAFLQTEAAEAVPATSAPAVPPGQRTAASLFDDLMADPPNAGAGFGPISTATTNGTVGVPPKADAGEPEADAEADDVFDAEVDDVADDVADAEAEVDADQARVGAETEAGDDSDADPADVVADADAAGDEPTVTVAEPEKPTVKATEGAELDAAPEDVRAAPQSDGAFKPSGSRVH